jgi:hypothetical protein
MGHEAHIGRHEQARIEAPEGDERAKRYPHRDARRARAETEALATPLLVLYALHDAVMEPMTGAVTGPSPAESWTMSRDGLVYEIVLRENARSHNGDPVTSDDVNLSFGPRGSRIPSCILRPWEARPGDSPCSLVFGEETACRDRTCRRFDAASARKPSSMLDDGDVRQHT